MLSQGWTNLGQKEKAASLNTCFDEFCGKDPGVRGVFNGSYRSGNHESFVDELHDVDSEDACPQTHSEASSDLSYEWIISVFQDICETFDD